MTEVKYTRQTVSSVKWWVPGKLFSLTTTRDRAFGFAAGQFARLGLPANLASDEEPTIWRAYSMVNAPSQEGLEFYSVVVPEGEFSPRLASLRPGDSIYIDKTAFGFLTLDRFAAGGDLWLLCTGTGLSAYLSMLQDPATWTKFDRIVLVHGVRTASELAYKDVLEAWSHGGLPDAPQEGSARFTYIPVATRQALPNKPQARITTLIEENGLAELAGFDLAPEHAKVMLCGNPTMVTDARKLLTERGFAVGRRGNLGNLAVENYW